jgi:hypothetical protein
MKNLHTELPAQLERRIEAAWRGGPNQDQRKDQFLTMLLNLGLTEYRRRHREELAPHSHGRGAAPPTAGNILRFPQ